MNIQQSVDILLKETEFELVEGTFQVLNETLCKWIAKVKTTHLTAPGETNKIFTIIADPYGYIVIENENLPLVAAWCAKHHD